MRVVPEGASLTRDAEIVQERVVGSDGALIHKGSTIVLVGIMLEQSVPVLLKTKNEQTKGYKSL